MGTNGYVYRRRVIDGYQEMQYQHRYVVEEFLGRPLLTTENVHHLNGDRTNNSLDNLQLWEGSQPSGQRVEDKISWAKELLTNYGYTTILTRNVVTSLRSPSAG